MYVAISAEDQNLHARLDPHFGRCRYFLLIDSDSMQLEVFENDRTEFSPGTGIQTAELLVSNGVDAVITGMCGPMTAQMLTAAGVDLYLGQAGTVKDVLMRFKQGKLSTVGGVNTGSKRRATLKAPGKANRAGFDNNDRRGRSGQKARRGSMKQRFSAAAGRGPGSDSGGEQADAEQMLDRIRIQINSMRQKVDNIMHRISPPKKNS